MPKVGESGKSYRRRTRNSTTGRMSPAAARRKSLRRKKTKEVNKPKQQIECPGPAKRKPRMGKGKTNNVKQKVSDVKLKPKKSEIVLNIETNLNCVSGDNPEPIVKQEPLEEVDYFESANQPLEDPLELNSEMKVEYDCVTNEDNISPEKQLLFEKITNNLNLKTNNNQLENESFEMSILKTKFSKMTPIQNKDEALALIKLLESFALCKENFRLIGFIERLQNHFEKIS